MLVHPLWLLPFRTGFINCLFCADRLYAFSPGYSYLHQECPASVSYLPFIVL
jgi:hypothetical protein